MDTSSVTSITRIFRSSGNGHRFFYFVNGRLKTFATLKDDINQQIAELFGALNGAFLTKTAVAVAVAALPLMVQSAYALDSNALPTGYQSVDGSHTFDQNGNVLNITTGANNSIVNYNTFDIGSNATVNMNLPGAQSAILNRVLGGNLSEIFGTLNSNGQVFLINPAGIVFGNTATINVSGLVASTLNISNEKFMNGHFEFSRVDGSAPASINILNGAQINIANGGSANFLSSAFSNAGNVSAPGGRINIAIGDRVSLNSDLIGLTVNEALQDRIQGIAAVANSGNLTAESIKILASTLKEGVLDTIVNNTGRIRANKVLDGSGGTIELIADNGIVANGVDGILDASGTTGGTVIMNSEATLNQGQVLATGSEGQGGTVNLLGDKVALTGNALVDVSGQTGGGNINIGGGYQGADPTLRNSERTFITDGVALLANAVETGNGGQVVVWSDGDTLFEGNIQAKGGAQSGNGGEVEVSGKENLMFNGLVDTSAAFGETGNLLLDPRDLTIVDGGNTGTNLNDVDAFSDSPGTDMTINDGRINASATNVTLRANRDMTFGNNVDINLTGTKTFTAEAGRDMTVNTTANITAQSVTLTAGDDLTVLGDITANGGSVNLTSGQSFAGIGGSGTGGDVTIGSSSIIQSNGGAVNLTSLQDDVHIDGDIVSSGGAVNITAEDDVNIDSSGDVNSGAGNVTLNADSDASGSGDLYIDGEVIANNSTVNLIGTTLQIDGSGSVNAGATGTVNIRPSDVKNVTVFTNDFNGDNDTGSTMDVSGQELGRISAGTVNIGSSVPGSMNDIVISNGTSPNLGTLGYNINLLAARDITGGNQNVTLGAKTLNVTAGRDVNLANQNVFTNATAGRDAIVANNATGLTFNNVSATRNVNLSSTGNNRAITGNDVTATTGSVSVSTTGANSAITLNNITAASSGINLSTITSLAVAGTVITPGTLTINTGSGSATSTGAAGGGAIQGDVGTLTALSSGGTIKFADSDGLTLNNVDLGSGTLQVTAGSGAASNGAAESNLTLTGINRAGTLSLTASGANNIQQASGSSVQGNTLNATTTGAGQTITLDNADFANAAFVTNNGDATYVDRDGVNLNFALGSGRMEATASPVVPVGANNGVAETSLNLVNNSSAQTVTLITSNAHSITQSAGSTVAGQTLNANTLGSGSVTLTDADFTDVNALIVNGNITYVDRDGFNLRTNVLAGNVNATAQGAGLASNNGANESNLTLTGNSRANTFDLMANGANNIQQAVGSTVRGTTLNATTTGSGQSISLADADLANVNLVTNNGNATYVDRDGVNANVQVGTGSANITVAGAGVLSNNGVAESGLNFTGANVVANLTVNVNDQNLTQSAGSSLTGTNLTVNTTTGNTNLGNTGDADFATVTLNSTGATTQNYTDLDGFKATVNAPNASVVLTAGKTGTDTNGNPLAPAIPETTLLLSNVTAGNLTLNTLNGTTLAAEAGVDLVGNRLDVNTNGNLTLGLDQNLDFAEYTVTSSGVGNTIALNDTDGFDLVGMSAAGSTVNLTSAVSGTPVNLNGKPVAGNTESGIRFVSGSNTAGTLNLTANGGQGISQTGGTLQGTNLNANVNGAGNIALTNTDFDNVSLATTGGSSIVFQDRDGFNINASAPTAGSSITARAGVAGVTANNGSVSTDLNVTGTGIVGGSTAILSNAGGNININSKIQLSGSTTELDALGSINQSLLAGSEITSSHVVARSATGSISLNNLGNTVTNFAAQALTAGQDIGFISNVGFAISNVVGPTITVNGVQAADRVIIRSTTGNISQDAGTLFFGNDLEATTVGAARTITIGDADFNSVRFTTNNGNASYADRDGFSGSGAVGTGTLSLTAAQAGLLSNNSNAESNLTLTENTTGATVNLTANGANNILQAPASTVQGGTLNAVTTGAGSSVTLNNADFNTANLTTNNGNATYTDRDGVKVTVQAGSGTAILTAGSGGTANNVTAETDLTFVGANNASSMAAITNGANNILQAVGSTITGSGLNASTTGTGVINLTDADFASVFLTTNNQNAIYRDRDGFGVSVNVGTGTATLTAAQAGVASNNGAAESNLNFTGNTTAATLNATANGANNITQAAGSTVQGTQLLATTNGAGQSITLTDADFADVRLTTNNGNATYADRDGFIAISTTAGTGTVNLTAGAAGVLSNNSAAETHMQFGGINTAQTFNLVSNGIHTIDQTGPSRIQGSTVNATVNGAGLTLRLGNADFTNANLTINNGNVIYRDADGVTLNVQAGTGIADIQVATAGATANNASVESNLILSGNNTAGTLSLTANGANSISQQGGGTVQGGTLNATTNGVGQSVNLGDTDFNTANLTTNNGTVFYQDRDGFTANVQAGTGNATLIAQGVGVTSNNGVAENNLTLTGANQANTLNLTANGANSIQQAVGSTVRGTTLNATTSTGSITLTDADFANANLNTNSANATYVDRDGVNVTVNVGSGTGNVTVAGAGVLSNNANSESNLTLVGNSTAGNLILTANGANNIQQAGGSTVQGANLSATTNGLLRTINLTDADFTNVNLTTNNGTISYRDRDGFNATVNSGIGTANLTAAQAGVASNNGAAESNLTMTGSNSANTFNLTANGANNIQQAVGSSIQGDNLNAVTNGAGSSINLTNADFADVDLTTNNGNATYADRDGFNLNANAGSGTVSATAAAIAVSANNGDTETDLTLTGNNTAATFNLIANGNNNIGQGFLSSVQGTTVNATTTGAGNSINLNNADFTNANFVTSNGNATYRDRDGVNLTFNLGAGTMDATVQPLIPVSANNGVGETNLNLISNNLASTVNLTTFGLHNITQNAGSTVAGQTLTANTLGSGSTVLTDADFTDVNAFALNGNITYVDRDGFNLTATTLFGTVNATAAGAGVASNNSILEANLNFVGANAAQTFNVTANGANNITESAGATIAGTNMNATTTGVGQSITLNDADFANVTLATNNGNATYRDRDGFTVNVNTGTGTASLTESSNAVVSSNNLAGETALTFVGNSTVQTLNVTTTDNVNINQAGGSTIQGTNLNTQTLNSGASTALTDTDFAVVNASANNNNVTIVDRDGAQLTANAGTGTVSFTAGGAGLASNNGAAEANLTIANANAAQTFNLTATGGIGIQQLAGSTMNGTNLNVVIANGNTNIGNLGNADFANVTFNATGAGVQQYTDLDGFEVAGSVANGTLTLLGGKTGTDTNGNPLAPANPENNIILGNLTAKTLNLTSQNGIGIVIKPGATVTGTTMNLTTNASVNLGNAPGDKLDFAEYSVTSAGVGNTIAVGDTDGFDILGVSAPNSTISLTSSVSGTSTDFNGNPLSGSGNTEADMRLATAADKTAQTLNLTARDTDRILQVSTNRVIANRLNVVTNGGNSTITNNTNQVSNYTVNAPSGTHRLNNDVNLNILASNSGTGDIIVNNDGAVNVTQLVQGDDITINTTNTNSTVTVQANITGTGGVSVNTANGSSRIIQQGGTTVSGNTVSYNTAGTNANIEVNNGANVNGTNGVLLSTTGNNGDVMLDGNLTSTAGSVLVTTSNTNAGITQGASSVVNSATTSAFRTTGSTANIQLSGDTTSGTSTLVQTTGNNSDIRLTSTSSIDAGTTATVSTTSSNADIRQDSGSTVTSVGLATLSTTGFTNASITVNGRVESTGAGVNVTTTGLGSDITQAAAGAGTDGIFANGQAQVATAGLDSNISLAGKVNSSAANVRVATSGLDSDIRLTGTSNLNAATTADVITTGLAAEIRQDSGSQVVAGTNANVTTSGAGADIRVNGRVEALGGNITVRTTGLDSDITQNAGVDPLDGLFASSNVNVQTTNSFSDITLNGKSEAGSDINVTTTGALDADISINGLAQLKSLDDVTISTTGAGSDITTASGSSVIAEEDIQVTTTGAFAGINLNGRLQATDPAGAVTVSTTGFDSDINQNSPTAADEVIATNAVAYSTSGDQSGITLNGKSTSTSDSVTASTTGTNADILLTGNSDVQAKNVAVFTTTGNNSGITQQAGSKVAGANAVAATTTGTNADVFLAGQIDSSAGSVVVITTGNNSDVTQVDGSVINAEQQVVIVTTGNDMAVNLDGDITANQAGIVVLSAGASNAPVTLGANSTLNATGPNADIFIQTVGDSSTITQVAGGTASAGRNLTYFTFGPNAGVTLGGTSTAGNSLLATTFGDNSTVLLQSTSALVATVGDLSVITNNTNSGITQEAGSTANAGQDLNFLTLADDSAVTLGGANTAGRDAIVNTGGNNSTITQETTSTVNAGRDAQFATIGSDNAGITLNGSTTAGRDALATTQGTNSSITMTAGSSLIAANNGLLQTNGAGSNMTLGGLVSVNNRLDVQTLNSTGQINLLATGSLFANNGLIHLKSNQQELSGIVSAGLASGVIQISAFDPGTTIGLGGGAGILNLSQAEFNNMFARDIIIGDQTTNSLMTIGLVDLSGKPSTDLTLNTLFSIQESTPTEDASGPNIIMANDRNVFFTGGATGVADRLTSTGVQFVGNQDSIFGDIDVQLPGAGLAFVKLPGSDFFSGKSIRVITPFGSAFVNVPDDDSSRSLRNLAGALNARAASLIINQFNNTTIQLPGSVNLIPSTFGGFGSANAPIVPFRAF